MSPKRYRRSISIPLVSSQPQLLPSSGITLVGTSHFPAAEADSHSAYEVTINVLSRFARYCKQCRDVQGWYTYGREQNGVVETSPPCDDGRSRRCQARAQTRLRAWVSIPPPPNLVPVSSQLRLDMSLSVFARPFIAAGCNDECIARAIRKHSFASSQYGCTHVPLWRFLISPRTLLMLCFRQARRSSHRS